MKKAHLRAAAIACALTTTAVVCVGLASKVTAGLPNIDVGLLAGVMQLVQQDYVHPIDSSELTNDALKGMLSRLDPHSAYMTEQEFRESTEDMRGKFGGVGLKISEHNGVPTVISPIDDTPAAHADMQPGDAIVSIDGESTQGADLMQVVSRIRGAPGTTVKLTIMRGDKPPIEVPLTRQIIEVHSVKSKLEPDDIGYVRISQFGRETPIELRQALSTLQKDAGGKLAGLVLDLRNDPGGLLTSAVDISSDFMNGGTIVSIHGRISSDDRTFAAPATGALLPDVPMVVLINGASASASEIVAAALQDRHRATVMGTQSFGKGSVQTVIPIKDHGALRLTTALYYTPSGRSIQDQGVTPDVVIEAPKDEQIANSMVWREAQLHGAFANPGPLAKSQGQANAKRASDQPASPPIKELLIGTDHDVQLAAALSRLKGANKPNSADVDKSTL